MQIKFYKLSSIILFFTGLLLPLEGILQNSFNLPGAVKFFYIFLIISTGLFFLIPQKFFWKQMDKTLIGLYLLLFSWIVISVAINYGTIPTGYAIFSQKSSIDAPEVRSLFYGVFKPALFLLFIFCVSLLFNSKEALKYFLKGLFILTAISCTYGLYQLIGYYLGLPGTAIFSGHGNQDIMLGPIRRIEGMFFEPGPNAKFLSMIFPLVCYQVIEKCKINTVFNKTFLKILLFLVTIIMIMTISPIGFFTIPLTLLFVFLFNIKEINFRKKKTVKRAAIIFALFSCFLVGLKLSPLSYGNNANILQYFLNKTDETFGSMTNVMYDPDARSVRNYVALEMAKDYPIFGVGIGNAVFYYYKYAYFTEFKKDLFEKESQGIMNTYMNMLSQAGIVGFLIFMIIVFYPIYLYIRYYYLLRKSENFMLIQSFLVSYCLLITIAFNSSPNFFEINFWLLCIPIIKMINFERIKYKEQKLSKKISTFIEA